MFLTKILDLKVEEFVDKLVEVSAQLGLLYVSM